MSNNGKAPEAKLPEAQPNVRLKSVCISGTELEWAPGETHGYYCLEADGQVVRKAEVVADIGVVTAKPNEYGQIERQVNIVYKSGYVDTFIVADHLVVMNFQVSEIAVAQGPKLVVPGR